MRDATATAPTVTVGRRIPAPPGFLARLGTAPAIAILVGILCLFGLVMVGSASPLVSIHLYGSPWAIFIRQAMWMGVGIGVLLLFARVDYRWWRKMRGWARSGFAAWVRRATAAPVLMVKSTPSMSIPPFRGAAPGARC